jgi:hypothetical protein
MEASKLFLSSLAELHRYVGIGDDYAMLRAAALLRQLLMDESPLIHQVNRAFHLKIRFSVCGRKNAEVLLQMGPSFYSALAGIHRSGSMSHQLEELSLDEFLSTKVLKFGAHLLTVHDLISISANVLGGVHKGTARSEKEQAIESFNQKVFAFGHPICAAQMKPVVLVALEGLETLARAVRGE